MNKKYLSRIALFCISTLLVYSCANMASPSGGDYDFDPPVVIKSIPTSNQKQVKSGKVEIFFDELVQIEKPMEKVIVTPPQKNFPIIRAQNNKVIVELKDTLLPNTTYTIDFTDAIADNNEKNSLENFAISFSTGDVVDSLAVSGKVLSADNLEPIANIYVGIHSDLSDTAFTKKPFLRISRTNELGEFTIKGIAEGEYKIYALNDLNRDYKYDNPGEALAFQKTLIVPSTEQAVRQDSVYFEKLKKDTVVDVSYTKYLPDDIILRSFTSAFRRQYLQKHERLTDDAISIFFGAATSMPKIEVLNMKEDIADWSILERSIGNDTLKYWITKPSVVEIDTLNLRVSYFRTDSLNVPQMTTDTLSFINRNKKSQQKAKEKAKDNKKKKKEEIIFLNIAAEIGQPMDIYKDIKIQFDYPVLDLDKEKLNLQHMVDSVYQNITYELRRDSLNPRQYAISYPWKPGEKYRLAIDSASIHSYNGLWNDKLETSFKVKTIDQYGNLYINIQSLPEGMPAFVELLDKSDRPTKYTTVKEGGALFMNLDPGTYYARIVLDTNGNGKWDTGEYNKDLEPEIVYYYPKSFEVKANWDIEEDWNIGELPLDKQKPLDITKNKPKEQESRKRMMERRDAQRDKSRKEQERGQSQNNFDRNNPNRNYNNPNNNTFR